MPAPPLVVDLHSDLAIDLHERRVAGERDVFRRRHGPQLAAAGVRVQVLAAFTPTALVPEGALRRTLGLLDAVRREEQESDGTLRVVTTAAELDAALAAGAIAAVLALEGCEAVGRDPALVATLARLGVRMASLTWNRANDLADGTLEDRGAGITPLGRRALAELAAHGIALDVSHLTDRAVRDALDSFDGALLASHSNASAIHPSPRNLSDELLAAIGARGGVVGVNAVPSFVGPGDQITGMVAHARHVAAVAGPDAPAFGADLTAFLGPSAPEPAELGPPAGDPVLRALPEPARETIYAEVAAGVRDAAGDAAVEALAHGNALAFLRRALG